MKHLLLSLFLCGMGCTSLMAQENTASTIQAFLNQHAEQQGLQLSDVAQWGISSQHISNTSGAHYVYIHQTYQGVEVANGVATIALKDGEVVSMGNRLIPHLQKRINSTAPSLTPIQAIERAAQALDLSAPTGLRALEPISTTHFIYNKGGISQEDIPVKLVYYANGDEGVGLAWDLSIYTLDGENWWSVKVDARTGQLLNRVDWVSHCNLKHGRQNLGRHTHFSGPSFPAPETMMQPDQYTVFALPLESPSHGARSIVTDPADTLASPYGWHDTNGATGAEYTITRGNNVFAYDDVNNNNQPGFSPDGGAVLEFNFPFVPNTAPGSYQPAAITNLFYMNNMMHDIWYHYGFDEASGNFQVNNYGRGGSDDDAVNAEAQDGGGTNNANFATPPDGSNPRMQMYLWTTGGGGATNILEVNTPSTVAGNYSGSGATYGPGLPTTPLTGDFALVEDNTAPINDGCEVITNGASLTGRIAIIDRGNCNFVTKVESAQDEGAIAVIIVNNVAGATFQMGGTNPNITIPSIMITQADGNAIKAAMANGTVNGTISGGGGNVNDRDGDFDNGIIAHEYGHGISTRLTGGRTNSGCLSSAEQMGEGWSDWFGLMLTIEPGDQASDVRGIGTFAAGQSTTGQGIRPAPYSTDFNVNNFTYGNTNNTGQISQPHGLGFVYATALWDLTWALIDQYGGTPDPDLYNGTGGNNIAMMLVTESLKLQPCNPGMLDGRDAILQADQLLYNGIHECLIWEVFARRGFGVNADQGSVNSRTDQTEGFDVPTFCQNATVPPVASFTASSQNSCNRSIAFTDNSTDVPQSWVWTFGDGDSSTVRNPVHTYRQSGTYTVTLIVTNTQGQDTSSLQVVIALPNAPFASDVQVCSGDTATIIATASGEVRWRNIANNIIYRGDTLVIPNTGSVQTYYMENVVSTASQFVGAANPNVGSGAIHSSAYHGALNFTASRALDIVSVYVEADGAGPRTFYLASGTNTNGGVPGAGDIVDQVTVNLVDGGQRVDLNLSVPAPGAYNLGGNQVDLFRNDAGASYPYTLANYMTITSSSAGTNPTGYYYYFYDIEVRDPACISAPDTVQVIPVVSAFTFADNNNIYNFTDASIDATSWFWDFDDNGATSTAQNPTHTYTANGTYDVTLTINNGACTSTQTITITTINVDKINGDLPTVQLLPNPAQDQTALLLSRAASEDLQVELRDATGKLLLESNLPRGNTRLDLNIEALPAGVYMISLQGEQFTRTEKLVVE